MLRLNETGLAHLAAALDKVSPTLSVEDVRPLIENDPLFSEARRRPVTLGLLGLIDGTVNVELLPSMVEGQASLSEVVWDAFAAGWAARMEKHDPGELEAAEVAFAQEYPGHHARLMEARRA